MTDDTSANDDSNSTTMLSRRNVFIGLGVAGAGTLAALDQFTDVLEGRDFNIGGEDPPLTNPNDDNGDAAFQTPWDADSLVISVEWKEQDSTSDSWFENGFRNHGAYDELQNAVAFWNDYINENSAFDLTLTFEPNTDDPDIMLRQANTIQGCGMTQYKGPDYRSDNFGKQVCQLDTLTETPTGNDLPVTGVIGEGAKGPNVYRLIAQHAIGRLLGYDIWSDPVHVMNPKILITPAHKLSPSGNPEKLPGSPKNLYHPVARGKHRQRLTMLTTESVTELQPPSADTIGILKGLRQTTNSRIDAMTTEFDEFLNNVTELELDMYADAYRETIKTEDIQYLNNTVALIEEVLDNYTHEELAAGPDELDVIVDRFETIHNWTETTAPYDLRIHRYATDEIWSAWAAEQTPTATETDSA